MFYYLKHNTHLDANCFISNYRIANIILLIKLFDLHVLDT